MNTDQNMDWYFVGADFGQSRDYTAIAVLERAETAGKVDHMVRAHEKEIALRLRYLERIPLGTPYPEVVERVVEVTRNSKLAGRCHLAGDGTGGGQAGGGPATAGEAGCDPDAGDDHERAGGEYRPRVLPGAEAGPDHRATGGAAARGVADRGGAEVWAKAGGRADGGGSEGIAGGERAIRGVARGDARRPGVRSGAGVLERGEGVPERAARERPLVDECT